MGTAQQNCWWDARFDPRFQLGLQRLSVLSGYPTVQYVSGFKYLVTRVFFNLVPRPISVSGNKAAGCEARVKNSNRVSSAAESQKSTMAYRKRTSPVWEFFEPPTVTKVNGKDIKWVQCLLCTQQLAYGGGTANLISHLQAKHLEEYKRCTNDSSKSCKTQSTLHGFSRVCPLERATRYHHHKAYCWVCRAGSSPYQCYWWTGLHEATELPWTRVQSAKSSPLYALSLMLFGIQTVLKVETSSTAAEMVYGTTLRLPREFFAAFPTTLSYKEELSSE